MARNASSPSTAWRSFQEAPVNAIVKEFKVIDRVSRQEITDHTLLQAMLEQPAGRTPILTRELICAVIRNQSWSNYTARQGRRDGAARAADSKSG